MSGGGAVGLPQPADTVDELIACDPNLHVGF